MLSSRCVGMYNHLLACIAFLYILGLPSHSSKSILSRYGIKLGGEEIICLSCASPQKFHEVFRDLAIPLEPAEEVQHLLSKPKRFTQLRKGENWTQILKDAIVKATGKFEKSLQP